MGKPLEYWIALLASSAYVFHKGADKSLLSRVTMTAISAALGYSLTPDLSLISGRPEILTLVVVTSTVYLVLDFVSVLISDREFLSALLKRIIKK